MTSCDSSVSVRSERADAAAADKQKEEPVERSGSQKMTGPNAHARRREETLGQWQTKVRDRENCAGMQSGTRDEKGQGKRAGAVKSGSDMQKAEIKGKSWTRPKTGW